MPASHCSRAGSSAPLFLVTLVPLLGFTALAVDHGLLRLAQAELQTAVDAAALAGAGRLDGTSLGLDAAVLGALDLASRNTILGEALSLDATSVELGTLHEGTFVPTLAPLEVDAVRVTAPLLEVDTPFARAAFGIAQRAVSASSLARVTVEREAGSVPCPLPLALPDCLYDPEEPRQFLGLRLASSGVDNVGWALLEGSVSASGIRDHLEDPCSGPDGRVGQTLHMSDGVVDAALGTLRREIDASPDRWEEELWGPQPPPMGSDGQGPSQSTLEDYGRVLAGPIFLFHDPSGACGSATQFHQSAAVSGFAWAAIYDVDDHGGGRNVRVLVDFAWEYEGGTGGDGQGNLTYLHPFLVR